jgi:subtilisin family serine protease
MRFVSYFKMIHATLVLKRSIVPIALVLLVSLLVTQPARMQQGETDTDGIKLNSQPYIPDRVVVQLNAGFDIRTVAVMYGLDPVPIDQVETGLPLATNYLMRIVDGSTVEQKVAQLVADVLRIALAEPNYNYTAPEAARPTWSVGDSFASIAAGRKFYNSQWARSKIRLDEAHLVTRGATSTVPPVPVIIAVLDTGIDLNHPAFSGRLVPGYDFVGNDADPSEEGSTQIGPYGHGTLVAGLIAMVAPEAKIMPIRVLGVDGRGNFYTLARAIKYALDNGADVINLSLSTPSSSKLVSDVFYAELDRDTDPIGSMPGAVVVAAAGNSGTEVREYPAAVDEDPTRVPRRGRCVLSVAASNGDDLLSVFSTHGSWVSVMAPGERIIGPVPFNRYGVWAGTSMASPLVAGEVALVRAANPAAAARDVVTHIKNHSVAVPGQQIRIDAALAVSTLIPTTDKR